MCPHFYSTVCRVPERERDRESDREFGRTRLILVSAIMVVLMKEMFLEPLKLDRIRVSGVKKEKKIEGNSLVRRNSSLFNRYFGGTHYVLDTGLGTE